MGLVAERRRTRGAKTTLNRRSTLIEPIVNLTILSAASESIFDQNVVLESEVLVEKILGDGGRFLEHVAEELSRALLHGEEVVHELIAQIYALSESIEVNGAERKEWWGGWSGS